MSFSKMPISKKIIAGYATFFAVLMIISCFVIFQNITSLHKSETLETNNESDIYIKTALEDFLNARIRVRSMTLSDDYSDDTYSTAEAYLDDAIDMLNFAIDYANTHNMSQRTQILHSSLANAEKYKEAMIDLHLANRRRLSNKNEMPALGRAVMDSVTAVIDAEELEFGASLETGATDATVTYDRLRELDDIILDLYNARLTSTRLSYLNDITAYDTIIASIDAVETTLSGYAELIPESRRGLISAALTELVAYRECFDIHRDILELTGHYADLFNSIAADIQSELGDASNVASGELRALVDSMVSSSKISLTIVILLMAVALVLNIILAFIIVSSINKSLNDSIKKLSMATSNVVSASSQLTSAANDLAQGGSEQASSIEETSATMNESASMIRQSTENTREAANLVSDTASNAVKGVSEMENLIEFMNKLSRSSAEIEQIIGSITDISFQTNILALNASVEAARAGEAGKSFTVVAEEVRSLSQKSSEAANNTSLIINTNIGLSEESVKKSKSVGESLKVISTSIQKVNNLINEIAEASEEQSRGIEQVNIALSQMEKVTQSNAAISQESAASAGELKNQADILEQITIEIQELVGRAKAV